MSGKDTLPAIAPVLSSTNDVARALAAGVLGELGPGSNPFIPRLQSMLSDTALLVRFNAAHALGKLDADPSIFLPVLMACFHEGDADLRSCVLDEISKLKERAAPVVPDLAKSFATCTNDNDRWGMLTHSLKSTPTPRRLSGAQ